jgi:hypothetical protein
MSDDILEEPFILATFHHPHLAVKNINLDLKLLQSHHVFTTSGCKARFDLT